jgi:hypothetical protein
MGVFCMSCAKHFINLHYSMSCVFERRYVLWLRGTIGNLILYHLLPGDSYIEEFYPLRYNTMQSVISQKITLYNHRCENLKSYIFLWAYFFFNREILFFCFCRVISELHSECWSAVLNRHYRFNNVYDLFNSAICISEFTSSNVGMSD